ncbi:unnamed protein product [Callosobruchus maculatus]|uniref:Uncharacterized protein n=2 Tax=Callosobruchus maculatus TaxID=64391 RepID=A0A653CFI9_CALMS|nr:unnamed protein product [Callosobruchus maculatus]
MVFAAKAIGKQVGIYSSWCPFVMTSGNIFISSVWFSMVSLTLLFGVVTILFPKELPQLAIRRSVDSVVNLATGRHNTQQEPITDGFIKTLTRIVNNKFLMLNLMAYTLVQSALINFRLFEHAFNQSKYRSSLDMFATNFNESGLNQFTSHLLEQPIVAIFSVTTGLLLAKTRPKAKHLVTWNITVFLIIFMMFTSTVFWECLDTNDADVKIRHNVTYIKIEDSCINKNACKLIQALAQVNSVIIYGLMASVVMSNTVINIRSVDVRDIPVAIGLQTTFSGLVPYIFIRSIYYFSADGFFCLIEGENGCQYYSANLSIFLSTLTAALIFVAVLISLAILYVLQDIQLYQDKPEPCDSRDIDIVHLTMVDTTEGNAASHVPVAQVEIVSGPDGFTVRDLNVPTAGVDEVDFDSEAHKSLPITDLDKEEPEPEPSTSNTALRLYNVSLEDILDTLGDDFDSDFEDANEKPGTSTAKHDKDFEDDWDSPTPEKLSEEIRRKVPRRLEFPSFADIKQFSFRNRLAPIKEAHEIPEAGDNAGEEDFTSAIEMVVLKKKEDVKETYGDNMLE